MRQPGFTAPGLLIIAILLLVGMAGAAPAAAWQDASPAAGTPAVIEIQPTQAPAQPTTVPAGDPSAARRNRRRHPRAVVSERR